MRVGSDVIGRPEDGFPNFSNYACTNGVIWTRINKTVMVSSQQSADSKTKSKSEKRVLRKPDALIAAAFR